MKSVLTRDSHCGFHWEGKAADEGQGSCSWWWCGGGRRGKGAFIIRITKTACDSSLPRYKNHRRTEVLPVCPPLSKV